MAPNVRDQQIQREAVIQSTAAKVRDFEIVREAVIIPNASVRNIQVFREAIIVRGSGIFQPNICICT